MRAGRPSRLDQRSRITHPSAARSGSVRPSAGPSRSRCVDTSTLAAAVRQPEQPLAVREVERHQHPLRLGLPQVDEAVVGHGRAVERPVAAHRERLAGPAQRQQPPRQREHRARIGQLGGDVDLGDVIAQRQPGRNLRRAEAGVRRPVPRHRRAGRVAPQPEAGDVLAPGVLHLLGRDRHVLHAQLIAVVEGRRAAQGQQQQHRQAGLGRAAQAGRHARLVVVAQDVVGPGAGRQGRLVRVHQRADRSGVPGDAEHAEVERQVELVQVPRRSSGRGTASRSRGSRRSARAGGRRRARTCPAVLAGAGRPGWTSGWAMSWRCCCESYAPRGLLVSERRSGFGGLSRSAGSFMIRRTASSRKPSTPRSSQKRSTSSMAASTAGLRQLRSGCSVRKECR